MNTKLSQNLIIGLSLAALAGWAACAAEKVGGGTPGTAGTIGTGVAGTTGSGTGVAGTTGAGTGVAGTTGSGTGVAGTTGSGTGVAGTTGTGVAGTTGSGTGVAGTTGSGTGVAGTTGSGTGTGGAAGAAVVQKLCATKTTLMNPVLVNFETYTGTVTADMFAAPFGGATAGTGNAYTGPYSYGDGSVTPTLAILAGRPPSNWAVSQTATAAHTWGMGGGIWMNCADASTYKGITFWVRGSGPLNVFNVSLNMENTSMPDAANAAGGGTCTGTTDTCKPATKSDLPLTADWTQVSILWADFTAGMNGTTTVIPNGNDVTGIGWTVPLKFQLDPTVPADAAGPYIAVMGDLVINIDDVSFIP